MCNRDCNMPEQFQCRFCPKSYNEVLEFLDHFESHVSDNKPNQKEAQDISVQIVDINAENDKRTENEEIQSDIGGGGDSNSKENSSPKNKSREIIKTRKQCKLCDKTFSRKEYLKVHTKIIHENMKPFDCDYCESTFGQKFTLDRHVETVHENEQD